MLLVNAPPIYHCVADLSQPFDQILTPDISRSSSPTLMGGGRQADWMFAQRELLMNTGYDISIKIEEKEKEFEIKEKLFEMRYV